LGPAYDVAVADSTAYVANGPDLLVLDVADPASPSLQVSYQPPESVYAIQVLDSRAYLLAGDLGRTTTPNRLLILDIANLMDIRVLGSCNLPGPSNDLHVTNSTAYVADDEFGLQILDVSDPTAPTVLASTATGWHGWQVTAVGDHAYLADTLRGVAIIDVSNPNSPALLSTRERPTFVTDVFVDTNAAPLRGSDVSTQNDIGPYAYIVDPQKLWVTDMADPANPAIVSVTDLQAQDWSTLRVSVSPHEPTGQNLAYVTKEYNGLEIFNVTDPRNPARAGLFPAPAQTYFTDVSVSPAGTHAYVTSVGGVFPPTDGMLRVVDVTDPANPAQVAAYDTPGDAHRVHLSDGVAYVADGQTGLRLVDVQQPNNPTELAHIDPPAGASTDIVFVSEDQAYVGSNGASTWWLRAYDVSDPANPTPAAEQQGTGRARDIDRRDQHLFLAVSEPGEAQTSGAALTRSMRLTQNSTDGMHVLRTRDLSSAGRYRTLGAASVHTFGVSLPGFTITYVIIDRESFGLKTVSVGRPVPSPTATSSPTPTPTHTPSPTPETGCCQIYTDTCQVLTQQECLARGGTFRAGWICWQGQSCLPGTPTPTSTPSPTPTSTPTATPDPTPWIHPCLGVPEFCLSPPPCDPPQPGFKLVGYRHFWLTRNGLMAIHRFGPGDSQNYITIRDCKTLVNFVVCADEIQTCVYNPIFSVPPITSTPAEQPERPRPDLGDAPDSSNSNDNAPMTAYPGGATAQFPTVFGSGSPPFGPKHHNQRPLAGWLGAAVTLEEEADTGPDSDPHNNLNPVGDASDRDRGDDGVALPVSIDHCQTADLQFTVAVPESAPEVEWFVNVWFDWDRDGAWGDVLVCDSGRSAPEWAVRNLSLGTLEPGPHTIYTPFLPHNLDPQRPMWMRITLSDSPSDYADGGGPSTGYDYGETEDYYLTSFQEWSSPTLEPGESHDRTFGQCGNYAYHDQQHPGRQGMIRVGSEAVAYSLEGVVTVSITETGFEPFVVDVPVGGSVRWRNDTATSRRVIGGMSTTLYLPLFLRVHS
jgi:hypothetical protein